MPYRVQQPAWLISLFPSDSASSDVCLACLRGTRSRQSLNKGERPPFRWRGYDLAPFNQFDFFYCSREDSTRIFYTEEHLKHYRFLRKQCRKQIKALEKLHSEENCRFQRFSSDTLQQLQSLQKAAKKYELEERKDFLLFQQLWEKSVTFCQYRIELHHLRKTCRRIYERKSLPTEEERSQWTTWLLTNVRKEQWAVLKKIEGVFRSEGKRFPKLTAPDGQTLDEYFGPFGTEAGWYPGLPSGQVPGIIRIHVPHTNRYLSGLSAPQAAGPARAHEDNSIPPRETPLEIAVDLHRWAVNSLRPFTRTIRDSKSASRKNCTPAQRKPI